MIDLYLTLGELCKKHKNVEPKIIEECLQSGYNTHKAKINNKIIDALHKLADNREDMNVGDVVSMVMGFADEEKTVWISSK